VNAAGTDQGGPAAAIAELFAGNRRFVRDNLRHGRPRPREGRRRTPFAAVVACMDGRVPVEAAFDQDVGAVAVIRSAGHTLDRAMLGSVDVAVTVLKVNAVLVLGHTDCAAVRETVEALRSGHWPDGAAGHVIEQIAPAAREVGQDALVDEVIRQHVRLTVERLRRSVHLPHGDTMAVAGAVYDLDTGRVSPLD
jgi:carbonic anhydrase